MAAPQPFDPSLYVVAPRLSVPTAVALGIALLSARPKAATQPVRRAAGRLREAVVGLQQGWRQQLAAGVVSRSTPKEVDNRVDRGFRALAMRLEALTILSSHAGPDVETATRAYQRLFSGRLRFLNMAHRQQWAHCDRVLATLRDDAALAADVERLAGKVVLAEVRAAQEAYGAVLGITSAKESDEPVPLAEPLEAVREAIVAYAIQIVAMQADDPSRRPAARKALAPIDEVRAAQATHARRPDAPAPAAPTPELVDDATVTPDTPVPALDDEPAAGG